MGLSPRAGESPFPPFRSGPHPTGLPVWGRVSGHDPLPVSSSSARSPRDRPTLARDLSERLGVPWVPEYLREYADHKAADAGSIWDIIWTSADFEAVADGQAALEADALAAAASTARPGRCATTTSSPSRCGTSDTSARPPPPSPPGPSHPRSTSSPPPRAFPSSRTASATASTSGAPMTEWFRLALAAQPAPWIEAVSDREARVDQVVAWLHRPLCFWPRLALAEDQRPDRGDLRCRDGGDRRRPSTTASPDCSASTSPWSRRPWAGSPGRNSRRRSPAPAASGSSRPPRARWTPSSVRSPPCGT